ncbi:hypothetical protein L2E82_44673 [Cichorium intybus]|uniref:Uncharacterized protein n=1 Tax=Cichorium intybus TaxID=13427 RepID=A0ACB8ZR27_CICIN|nr:hypothetical protein L2E82_44673 [Cichorium intybus]
MTTLNDGENGGPLTVHTSYPYLQPVPPKILVEYKQFDLVEVWHRRGWWPAVITRTTPHSQYHVGLADGTRLFMDESEVDFGMDSASIIPSPCNIRLKVSSGKALVKMIVADPNRTFRVTVKGNTFHTDSIIPQLVLNPNDLRGTGCSSNIFRFSCGE